MKIENNLTMGAKDTLRNGLFRKIAYCSANPIIIVDNNLIVRFFNSVAEELTGIKKCDAIGSYIETHFANLLQMIEKKDGENTRNTIAINGRKFNMQLLQNEGEDGIEYTTFYLNSVSDELIVSKKLEKSKYILQEYEDIIEGSFDGILVTDGEGNVILVNESYVRVTGITKKEMLGKNMKELINPIWMKNSVVFSVIERKSPISLHHTTRTGKNIIVTGRPLINKAGEVSKVVVNARDITEIYELREELVRSRKRELLYMENQLGIDCDYDNGSAIIAVDNSMKEIFNLATKVSAFDTTILILGESGVGKDIMAQYIHRKSIRKEKPFIVINCGAIPEQLLESELFGYERGAFTGASREGKIGLFEASEGGILFLDEIGEMSLNLQVKLLNVLEARMITRVGSTKPIPVDIRIIAATNKNLESCIKSGEFREDLYYRLNVVQIKIPPLNDRKEDIAPLAFHFLQMYNRKYGQNKKLTYDVINELENHNWTGNIRELRNTLENMVIVSNNEFFQLNDLPWNNKRDNSIYESEGDLSEDEGLSLVNAVEKTEKQILRRAIKKYKTTREIAIAIGVNQSTVVRKMNKYDLMIE